MSSKNSNRKWIWTSSVLLVGFITYASFFPPVSKSDNAKSVAKVNGVSITSTQLYDALVASGGAQTLDSMITEELINQESKKAGIELTEADITKELQTVKASFGTDEEFNKALTNYNMTLDDLKKSMKTQVMLKKILEPQVKVTDDDIKKYYDENLETLKTPEQVQAAHISVATKEEADAILAKLKNGSDFAALAKESSTDTATKDKGGDLGYISAGQVDPAVEKAAFALQAGGLSSAVQTTTGYDIVKVTNHKAATTPTLEEKKESIKEKLVDEQISTLSQAWISQKKSEAKIENSLAT
ncbi:peptidyl-prolyl cis-trans isomerase [Paenibacillus roseipurpureus]|uniref:peptidylprolyl isomerase n=1 Tax=Paenibacillus roseopurpureus TaxID=2918901 RepID=A0AA96RKL6_9BACL|nr:peptidyl-prolyl cis-trans isomerase [Paenibacillus sp. MBLB1832]WNR44885.1 peptidyl-prolyl cis-trans isomerase [Paenibacillus sp. MBLB1832]